MDYYEFMGINKPLTKPLPISLPDPPVNIQKTEIKNRERKIPNHQYNEMIKLLPPDFKWYQYLELNPDLSKWIRTKEMSIIHWIRKGSHENRPYSGTNLSFNWNFYRYYYPDLSGITNEEESWKHYFFYGRSQRRIGSITICDWDGKLLTDVQPDYLVCHVECERDLALLCDEYDTGKIITPRTTFSHPRIIHQTQPLSSYPGKKLVIYPTHQEEDPQCLYTTNHEVPNSTYYPKFFYQGVYLSPNFIPPDEVPGNDPKVAVLIHIGNIAYWERFLPIIKELKPFNVDYYLNINVPLSPEKENEIKNALPGARIMCHPNVGRDIFGILHLISHIYNQKIDYTYFLILHTKSSEKWFNELIKPILGNRHQIELSFNLLKLSRVGLVGSRLWNNQDPFTSDIFEIRELKFLLESLHLHPDRPHVNYIGGTIFWIKYSLLRDFLNHSIPNLEEHLKLFYERRDLPWAWERLFGWIVNSAGSIIVGL